MRKELPIGISDYREVKEHQKYYVVDKSKMIKDFLQLGAKVTLITRPRRFGKTLNMSMMAEFFDVTKDSKDIFEGTYISQSEYASYMNQYPTIFISFANAKQNKQGIVEVIKYQLREAYRKYQIVFDNLVDEIDIEDYKRIFGEVKNVDNGDLRVVRQALVFLMDQLYKYYGKRVMVFIDEYDTPFIEAHVNGCYEEIKGELSLMLHNALKTSNSLQYAMMTGIQRVAKENIFSGLNNVKVRTVKDKQYGQYFGFTEEETKELLEYYGLDLYDGVKQMYDGYNIGEVEIYNPWSIVNYIDNKKLRPYWVNTSANVMIKQAMKQSDTSFQRGYEQLIEQGYLQTTLKMETSFFESSSTASLWGLFVNAGYLTISKTISEQRNKYEIRIPNQEVQEEFQSLTSYYLQVSETDLTELFDALRDEDELLFKETYQRLLLTLPSYHDLKDENSYHMFFVGVCAWLRNEYEIISNKEEGKGRCDVILKGKNEKQVSYIFEFKYTKEESNLKEMAKEAISQIKEKQYDANIDGNVIYVGMAHYHKDVEIVWKCK